MRFVKFGIVGTGPSGLYLGKYLTKYIKNCKVDYFEKSKQLLGLFKSGVAPDKHTIKHNSYQLLHNPNYRFFTNIHIGVDVGLEVLLEYYNVIFLCCGCEDCNEFKIPNEQFGVFNNLKLIHFYNSLPINPNLYNNLQIYQINKFRQDNYSTNSDTVGSATREGATIHRGEGANLLSRGEGANNIPLEGANNIPLEGANNIPLEGANSNTINYIPLKGANSNTINYIPQEGANNIPREGATIHREEGANKGEGSSIESYLSYLTGLESVSIGVLGSGNVCLDIIRMLVKSKQELEQLEVNPRYTELINNINIKRITVFARSSLRNSKFTNNELHSLFQHNIHITHSEPSLHSVNNINNIHTVDTVSNRKELKKLKLFNSYSNTNSVPEGVWVDFKFNTKILKVINNTQNHIQSILYTTNRDTLENTVESVENTVESVNSVESVGVDLLIKCIGYNSVSNGGILCGIDNVRVFGNGWAVNNCKGDLANIILNSIHLSKHIKQISHGFHHFDNDILHLFRQHFTPL
ncbi:NAD(P)-binding Rossmann-like domain protein [Theileria parva strain Muguga]|uniref:NAD(P)-binding Rossmann-like domain protein n=1 Tax=Theileria parva strain Muguga TaxID=333668 RepID=UPI001C61FD61|nr:NAD(P)-binding Rossmann-like domain protein [Theileria parva strain Muguga]EAN33154.2 NAD(P)-binding Rossmann-like domain protein [Theileria parva strain Muguga]